MPSNVAKKTSFIISVVLLALCFLIPVKTLAQEFTSQQNEQIKNMIGEYLFKNPQTLREAITALQAYEQNQQQLAARGALATHGASLYRSPHSFVAGNPNGDVTLIEFFDYNCGFCRRALDDILTLIDTDSNLKVIFKEFPILSEGSAFAARAAMASIKQGKYMEFHTALMQLRGSAEKNSVLELAEEIGLDVEKLQQEMKSDYISEEITKAQQTATAIGVNGTPAFVLGDRVIGGAVGIEELRRHIAEIRNSGS